MSDIVYCKDCAYAEPNNLPAYETVKLGVFCTRYKQNTAGIHGCDNGKLKQKTNADRIRNMTDEELAKKMSGLESFALTCGGGWPPEKWLEWLKQEAT